MLIPKSMQADVLQRVHAGHQGIEKGKIRAKSCVYWNGINNDLEEVVKRCETCQEHQRSNAKETLIPHEFSGRWNKASITERCEQPRGNKLRRNRIQIRETPPVRRLVRFADPVCDQVQVSPTPTQPLERSSPQRRGELQHAPQMVLKLVRDQLRQMYRMT